MKIRWLAILACLLITACSKTETNEVANNKLEPTKSASPAPVEVAAKEEMKAETAVDPKAESKSPAEQFKAVNNRFETARNEFMTAYRAAPEADRAKMAEDYPKAEGYADEMMRIATENPTDEAAFDSLLWVTGNVRSGELAEQALDLLFAEHIDNEGLVGVCRSLSYSPPSSEVEERLNRLIEESPHDSVKAAATFGLAGYLKKSEPQSQMVETLYQALISDYPDLIASERSNRTFKEVAEAALFEMNYLAIGKMAPDIEGEDFDGTSFKLSDYRGKVVVLDFWGDW